MKVGVKILFLAATLAAVGCAEEYSENRADPTAAKVLNQPDASGENSLIVYISSNVTVPMDMDRIAEAAGAVSYDRVFQKLASSESEICRFGLDRWYTLTFAPETDLRQAVELLSKEDGIERIQYNNRLKGLDEMKSASWKPAPATKATSNIQTPFNDPALASQWHYHSTQKGKPVDTSVPGSDINVYDAWKLTTGDPSIIVAVVDEGVAYNHPDLAANMWKNEKEIPGNGIDDDGNGYVDDVYGYNFSMDEPQISWNKLRPPSGGVGDQGHGTHVAGVVAAVNNNNVGISGIAGGSGKGDGVRIMSCQIYSGGQNCTEEYLAKAIRYAADNGASILQCSWGFQAGADLSDKSYKTRQPLVYAAIEYFENADRKELGFDNPINGGVAFFAAGNDGKEMSAYPGALADIISVTAFASDYKPTGYTNYGPGCNIAAPGGEFYYTSSDGNTYLCEGCVLSTMPEGYIYSTDYDGKGYGYMQGTSMACPHVSGVAALGLSYMKKLGKTCTKDEFKSMLLTSVNDMNAQCLGIKQTCLYAANYAIGPLSLSKYRGKMGTGSIDAWKFLMNIEGTPCLTAVVGLEQAVSLESIFGGSYSSLKYLGVDISDEDYRTLDLAAMPEIKAGRLVICPKKSGNVKITINAVAGGQTPGNGENMGGLTISKTVSLVARGVSSENGGWL